MTPGEDTARMVEEIRAILISFDWERDDRQYALEQIEMIVMTAEPGALEGSDG